MKVTAPDGTRWRVGRQWWPDRGKDLDDPGVADVLGGSGDGGSWLDLGDRPRPRQGGGGQPRAAAGA